MATFLQDTVSLLDTHLGFSTVSPPPSPQKDGVSRDLGWDSGRRGIDQQPSSLTHSLCTVLFTFSSSLGPHTGLRG